MSDNITPDQAADYDALAAVYEELLARVNRAVEVVSQLAKAQDESGNHFVEFTSEHVVDELERTMPGYWAVPSYGWRRLLVVMVHEAIQRRPDHDPTPVEP